MWSPGAGRSPGRASGGEEFIYPGTVHSFANAGIPAKFAPEAAGAAWTRTVAFLHRHLLA